MDLSLYGMIPCTSVPFMPIGGHSERNCKKKHCGSIECCTNGFPIRLDLLANCPLKSLVINFITLFAACSNPTKVESLSSPTSRREPSGAVRSASKNNDIFERVWINRYNKRIPRCQESGPHRAGNGLAQLLAA